MVAPLRFHRLPAFADRDVAPGMSRAASLSNLYICDTARSRAAHLRRGQAADTPCRAESESWHWSDPSAPHAPAASLPSPAHSSPRTNFRGRSRPRRRPAAAQRRVCRVQARSSDRRSVRRSQPAADVPSHPADFAPAPACTPLWSLPGFPASKAASSAAPPARSERPKASAPDAKPRGSRESPQPCRRATQPHAPSPDISLPTAARQAPGSAQPRATDRSERDKPRTTPACSPDQAHAARRSQKKPSPTLLLRCTDRLTRGPLRREPSDPATAERTLPNPCAPTAHRLCAVRPCLTTLESSKDRACARALHEGRESRPHSGREKREEPPDCRVRRCSRDRERGWRETRGSQRRACSRSTSDALREDALLPAPACQSSGRSRESSGSTARHIRRDESCRNRIVTGRSFSQKKNRKDGMQWPSFRKGDYIRTPSAR